MTVSESRSTLQIVHLGEDEVTRLCDLLAALAAAGNDEQFRPHPFDREYVAQLAALHGRDLYYVATLDERAIGYGLLRGWEEGYEIPSLGIAVHPDFRGLGIGGMLMHFLHAAARLRGSRRVRLRVVSTNATAIALYERTGYRFLAEGDVGEAGNTLLVAYKELDA